MTGVWPARHSKLPRVVEILDLLHKWFPAALADEGDSIGLIIGDPQAKVGRIAAALDPSIQAIRQAAASPSGILICHHPLFYRPVQRLDYSTPSGRLIAEAIKRNVAVIVCHSNADWAYGGVNDALAQKLGFVGLSPFSTLYPTAYRKLAVYVPATHLRKVSEAIFAAGGGLIGRYAKCSFRNEGLGTYFPMPGADPYAGAVGKLSEEPEVRLEVRVPVERRDAVLAAMRAAHPYEEVAFDLFPTEKQDPRGGVARIGRLKKSQKLAGLARHYARVLQVSNGRFVGDPAAVIEEVVICAGSGARLIDELKERPRCALVTGDVKYHEARKALDYGLSVIDLGHYGTEMPFIDAVVSLITEGLAELGKSVPVRTCAAEGDPFQRS